MTKKFPVVMLPTEKASDLCLYTPQTHDVRTDVLNHGNYNQRLYGLDKNPLYQHLYILSDDEIKEGNWYLWYNGKEWSLRQYSGAFNLPGSTKDSGKKIVATTDKSLGNQRENHFDVIPLPQLPESFIQAYIKAYNEGKPITEVDLLCEEVGNKEYDGIPQTRLDNTVIVRETQQYNFEDLCLLTTFIRENNHKWEGRGITNTEIIEQWKKNGKI